MGREARLRKQKRTEPMGVIEVLLACETLRHYQDSKGEDAAFTLFTGDLGVHIYIVSDQKLNQKVMAVIDSHPCDETRTTVRTFETENRRNVGNGEGEKEGSEKGRQKKESRRTKR